MPKWVSNIILKNLGFKILAVIFAIIVWLVIVNIEDPDKTQTYTISVHVDNEEYLEEMGKTYEVLNDTDVIAITITAERSVIEDLTATDFTATADLENINADLTKVPIKVSVSRYSNRVEITQQTQYLEVEVEDITSNTIGLDVETTGEPADGCTIESITTDPTSVTISGPESLVNRVKSAVVTIDVTDADSDFSQTAAITLLNKNGKEIANSRISMNVEQANVNITMQTGKTVTLSLRTTGTPAEGYSCTSVLPSVTEVKITGASAAIADIDTIEIDSDKLDLTDRTKGYTTKIDLEDFLPEGVYLQDGEPTTIEVDVTITGTEAATKKFKMPTDQIEVQNLTEGYELSFDKEKVTIVLIGNQSDLDKIDAGDLSGSIDVSNLDVGTHEVALVMDAEFTLETEVTVSVTISTGS